MNNTLQKLFEVVDKLKPYGIWYGNKPILTFQTVLETNYIVDNQLTEYPIESLNGYKKIIDYLYLTPDQFTMTAWIGETDSLAEAGVNYVNNNFLGGMDTVNLAREKLDILSKGIYDLKIKSKQRFYSHYTLKGYTIPKNMDNLSMTEFHLTFKKVETRNNWDDRDMRNLEFMDTKYGGNIIAKTADLLF